MGVKGWQVVYRGDRIQADLLGAVLEANGVRVEVFGDNAYGVGIDLSEARVMVPDEQATAARKLIREADADPTKAGEPEV